MASPIKLAKKAIRNEIKRRIALLSEEEKKQQSEIVCDKFLRTKEYTTSQRISVYLSMKNEIDTKEILQNMLESGKTCFIPRYSTKSSYMDMVRLKSMEEFDALPVTKWNIKQPLEDELSCETAFETGGLDLIIMPGVAFNVAGYRVGRGKGYYDSYIQKCSMAATGRPQLVALAFGEQIVDDVPVEDHDEAVDMVLYAEAKPE
ncbi:PREDICTED: 5-formyltetrahydrofolate cyclo-ligase-like [Priapulus caudatus]|uniref:5-formyltetrahydrofolate cyclo-ligase n=1 Tax=Priapulus caudatus TaxID=37621 RepID=A0ABM1ELB0_PRICU|nr:PREDICTED: 5-formyltetrahydrofolate cyclo-ligase-like [Priapulus caudatus]